jgi:hypothetical protein
MSGMSRREVFQFAMFFLASLSSLAPAPVSAAGEHAEPTMSSPAKLATHDNAVFRPDPSYADKPYDAEKQVEIYGGKYSNPTARPLLELGRELYTSGPFQPGINLAGKKNLLFPHVMAYGDYRIALAYNDNGLKEEWSLANLLNLDVDVKLTSTERVHAFFKPLDKGGNVTRFDFGGDNGENEEFEVQLDGNADAFFFEGELGPILSGITNRDVRIDLPFAAGLMPMLMQNGVWVEDAFTGVAWTIPARNSRLLDISNMDVTFFIGVDRVSTPALKNALGDLDDDDNNVFGVATFIEANEGYWEAGYGYIDGAGDQDDLSYNNATLSFTRRYAGLLSNSVRFIWNFGQNTDPGTNQTADGYLILIENQLITPKPLTLVPYLNLFMGIDRPQSLARAAGAGGVLKNTGIVFETDGMTGFPKLNDTAQETYGGAIGLEYLFSLEQQIVFETAVVRDDGANLIKGDQLGFGIRYQRPLTNALIFRSDLIWAVLEEDEDLFGVRFELRRKF